MIPGENVAFCDAEGVTYRTTRSTYFCWVTVHRIRLRRETNGTEICKHYVRVVMKSTR
jgi:hypothetical protein